MGATALLATAGLASAGASIFGGLQANKAAKDEAARIEEEGRLAQQEADEEAARRAKQVRKFAARQKLSFLKNGVRLEGTPLAVLDETQAEGQAEVDAISKRGQAISRLRTSQASQTRSSGRASLIGGFGGAASSLLTLGLGLRR